MIVHGVHISAEVATLLGPVLARWAEQWERHNGAPLIAPVRDVIAEIDAVGRLERQRRAERPRNVRNTADDPLLHDAEVMDIGRLLDTAEAGRLLGISPRAVRARCERGTLPATKTAHGWMIDPTSLDLATEAA